jgi:integrase
MKTVGLQKRPLLQGDMIDTVAKATPRKRRRGKSMSRRRGQNGYIEKSGKWYVVRFRTDVQGQEERTYRREKICLIKGPGFLTDSERKRKAREIITASGADSVEHFERVVASNLGTAFRKQAEGWLSYMQARKRKPLASSTYETWRCCLDKWLLPTLGDLPLSAVDNEPVKALVAKMAASEELGPKSINEYIKVVKMVVASAKDPKTRKQLYLVFWDAEYLDLPIVEKRNQKRPAFNGETVTGLVDHAKKYVQMIYILAASSGMRIGEVLGLQIDKHFADDFSTVLVRRKVRDCKVEDYLKTDNAYRDVDLHPSVVTMLKGFIGSRTSGFLFSSKKGKPLSNSNILSRHLHPGLHKLGWSDPSTGDETAGNHAFRRFRNTFLRKNHVPDDLIQFWLGHAGKSMTDEYSHVKEDVKYRKMIAEQVGIGFKLPVQTPSIAPNAPNCTEKLEVQIVA